jgi:predicted lipoprotein with Yx(FWY)xxD motif
VRQNNLRWAIVVAMIALTACSSSSKSNSPATSAAPTSTTAAAASATTTVSIGTTKFGQVLVNGTGKTAYIYDKDSAGTTKCTDACATVWPPLAVTGTATYGTGLAASMFSTITRSDGTRQLTVNGAPLYTYSGDTNTGDTTGQGLGDFYVAGSNGKMIGHGA